MLPHYNLAELSIPPVVFATGSFPDTAACQRDSAGTGCAAVCLVLPARRRVWQVKTIAV